MAIHQALMACLFHTHRLQRLPLLGFRNCEAVPASRRGDLERRCAKM